MRLAYFKALLGITKEQATVLIYEDMEQFKALMEQKQEVLNKINELNASDPKPLSEEEHALLVEIQDLDTKNNVEFKAQLNYAKEEVKKANMAMKREHYYANPYTVAMEGGIFFDRK